MYSSASSVRRGGGGLTERGFRHLPLTCSAAVYLAWAAGFWAWQVYRPVWCRVSLGMLSKLEYGSSVVTTTAPSSPPPPPPRPLPMTVVAAAAAAADRSSPPPPTSCNRTGAPSLSHAMLSGGSPWLTPHTTLVRVPSTSPSPGKLKGSITGGTNGQKQNNNRKKKKTLITYHQWRMYRKNRGRS